MKTFEITDAMRKRAEENKEGLESKDLESMRTYGVAFCDEFYRECQGNFDTWWMDDLCLMYVWDVAWMTVVIDWDIRRDTAEEFLEYVEDLENRIINLNSLVKKKPTK